MRSFLDADTGTAVGAYGQILHTDDGGATWVPQVSGVTSQLGAVAFLDGNTLIAGGSCGIILRTLDGGDSWTLQSSGTSEAIHGLSFVDANVGTAVGDHGVILRTTDAGNTWDLQIEGVPYGYLWSVSFVNENFGAAVGHDYMSRGGVFLLTEDGGITWNRRWAGTSLSLLAVSLADTSIWNVVGNQTIVRSNDGGDTWSEQRGCYILYATSFPDASTGWAVGSDCRPTGQVIMHTADSGKSWLPQDSGTTRTLYGVSFVDANVGTAVGELGLILRTEDGGNSWAVQYGTP